MLGLCLIASLAHWDYVGVMQEPTWEDTSAPGCGDHYVLAVKLIVAMQHMMHHAWCWGELNCVMLCMTK